MFDWFKITNFNNYKAAQDSILIEKNKSGQLVSRIASFEYDVEVLESDKSNLLNRYNASSYQEIYTYLNTNTRDIVPALQAMIYCYAQNNSNGNKIEPKLDVDTFYIEHQLQFKAIEDVAKINTKELFKLLKKLNKEENGKN